MSVKLYIYGFLYKSIPLKDVTKVEILNIMYSKTLKTKMLWQYRKERDKEKILYIENYVHVNIYPKTHRMSKIKGLRIIIHEEMQKNIQGGFVELWKYSIGYIMIRVIVRKIDESKDNKSKGNRGPYYSNNNKS